MRDIRQRLRRLEARQWKEIDRFLASLADEELAAVADGEPGAMECLWSAWCQRQTARVTVPRRRADVSPHHPR